jgi:hypothetical protein
MFSPKANPMLADWMTALPVVSRLLIAWLMMDHRNNAEIAVLITGVLYGLIPTAVVLLVMIVLIGFCTPVPIAVGLGVAACAVFTFAVARSGLFGAYGLCRICAHLDISCPAHCS